MVFQLTDKLAFPDPHYGDPDGLLAVGGDLSIDRLILAYSNGIFPVVRISGEELIQWWCPMDRFVIFPDEIHISHSMRTLINKGSTKSPLTRLSKTSYKPAENCGWNKKEPGSERR